MMKKTASILILCLALTLTACGQSKAPEIPETRETAAPEITAAETAVPETTVPETIAAETAAPETTVPETTAAQAPQDGIRPEFRQAMEDYEAFFTEYCAFMKKYQESDNPTGMLEDYMDFMDRCTQAMESLSALEEGEMSPEELDYYLEVMSRINELLADCL